MHHVPRDAGQSLPFLGDVNRSAELSRGWCVDGTHSGGLEDVIIV